MFHQILKVHLSTVTKIFQNFSKMPRSAGNCEPRNENLSRDPFFHFQTFVNQIVEEYQEFKNTKSTIPEERELILIEKLIRSIKKYDYSFECKCLQHIRNKVVRFWKLILY